MANGAAENDATRFVPPYAPSWVQVLVARIDRLPGPPWAAYAVITAALIVLIHTQVWSTGRAPFGTFDLANVYFGVLPVALLWTAGYLERVAGSAFDAFRPIDGSATWMVLQKIWFER